MMPLDPMQNALAPQQQAAPNALMAAPQAPPAAPQQPMASHLDHARNVISGMDISPADIPKQADTYGYMVSALGALLRKPGELTRKDVVQAGATAVGDGKTTAEGAVKFLSDLPDDPKQLRAVLQQRMMGALAAAVHFHGMMPPGMPPVQEGAPNAA